MSGIPGLNDARRAVLIDMAFELGGTGLAGFTQFLAAVSRGRWATAAAELRNSLLYSQVPRREQENMMILALGEFPSGIDCAEELIQHHEGLTLTAKPDVPGKWVIGWGHDLPADTTPFPCCTMYEALSWFTEDFARAKSAAIKDLGPELWNGDTTHG